jgi:hypothetical protein
MESTEPAYAEQARYLSRYKIAMTSDKRVVASLFRYLLKPLSKEQW